MANYYVSPSGSDSNVGTFSAPFKTMPKAFAVARHGDVVWCMVAVTEAETVVTKVPTSAPPPTTTPPPAPSPHGHTVTLLINGVQVDSEQAPLHYTLRSKGKTFNIEVRVS